MCVSSRPTDSKILPPTLTFFMPKKQKREWQNPEIYLPFRVSFLVHLIDVWNQKHCTACQIINKL